MSLLENATEIGPGILLIKKAINNSEEIVYRAIDKSRKEGLVDAEVAGSDGTRTDLSSRNTQRIDISPTYRNDVFWWTLAQKLWLYGDAYGNKYDVSFSQMENPQFLWYKQNEGFYTAHADAGPGLSRNFSAVLYLNDVEEGGETYFEHFDISVKPERDSLLLFPANFAYLHGAKVPVSGEKFVIVTWFEA